MSIPRTTKFSLPKLLLYGLLAFFIFSPGVSPSSTQQKVPVPTEQRDAARPGKTLVHFVTSRQPVSQNGALSEIKFFQSVLSYSNSIGVRVKNNVYVVLRFVSIGKILVANFLPRSAAPAHQR
jgi:hypothetical protein